MQLLYKKGLTAVLTALALANMGHAIADHRPWIEVRGVYGGMPNLPAGKTLADYGINAVWVGSGSVNEKLVQELHQQGVKLFAEFNTMHESSLLKQFPDATPVGIDGKPCPPPDGWQGVCPTHQGYRKSRMTAFRQTLQKADIDGVWLDYHHSHASWEQAVPNMPRTCFCNNCIKEFATTTKISIPEFINPVERNNWILKEHTTAWVAWRCNVFNDWVREFREILDQVRPDALLGTFHNPWSTEDYDGAVINLLAIDLKAQAQYVHVFSIMPYHARFGHYADPDWISRQVEWLGKHLGIQGSATDKNRIWPIVQLADWGEVVRTSQIPAILDHATRRPSTGVTIFHTSGLNQNPDRREALGRFYRSISPDGAPNK